MGPEECKDSTTTAVAQSRYCEVVYYNIPAPSALLIPTGNNINIYIAL